MHRLNQLILALAAALATARPAAADEASERELEAKLLNRPISLADAQVYSRAARVWRPLKAGRAKVRVVNLWSKPCMPCLAELPEMVKLVADWKQRSQKDVQFVFLADPPALTSAEDVVSFWSSPYADGLAQDCRGIKMSRKGVPTCLLTVPDEDPARSGSDELTRALRSEARPLTLLVDESGLIRQVFAGSIRGPRLKLLDDAIGRLLQAGEVRSRGR